MRESEVDVGDEFGNLIVKTKPFRKFFPERKHNKNRLYATVSCECGIIKDVPCADLVKGNINSCGCLRVKRLQKGTYAKDGVKRCCRCLKEFPITKFHKNNACKDSLNSNCIDCESVKRRLQCYGINQCEYESMLMKQDNKCACCGVGKSDWFRPFDVDHCHQTGTIRGLLCGKCNTTIGRLGDNIDSVKKSFDQIMSYLNKDTATTS